MSRRTFSALATVALLALTAQSVMAGPIFLRGKIVDGRFVAPEKPAEEVPAEGDVAEPAAPEAAETSAEAETNAELRYTIRYATITGEVNSYGPKFEAEEVVTGPETPETVVAVVPMAKQPNRWRDVELHAGPTSAKREAVEHFVLGGEKAEAFLQRLVKETGDVGFASFIGRSILVVPEFELSRRVNVLLKANYRQIEGEEFPEVVLPVPQTKWASGPVERLSISVDLDMADPLRTVFSPTHQAEIERGHLTAATVEVRQSDLHSENDFRLLWVEDEGDLGLRFLPFRLDGEEDGYFVLVGNPTGRADGSDVLDKDVTFVLDTSGSMRGEKIEQCRAAIEYCLDQLGENDRFNVVTFGSEVTSFRPNLVPNTAANHVAARDFVDDIVAHGRTNVGGALEAALAGDLTEGRPRITIFLTDGTPTAGELVPEKILESAAAANTSKSPVYVLGVGHDVNVHLLDRLAEASEGAAEFVDPDEEIDVKVAGLYDRLAHPVLTDVVVDFGDLDTHSLFPRKIPALYRNSQVMLFGRYREGGEATVRVAGTLAGEDREYALRIDAPAETTASTFDFVPPLWASRKIGYLLQEMRLHGEEPELLEEVVRLSKKYGIVTEYTQFVAVRAGVVRDGGRVLDGFAYGQQLAAANEIRNNGRFAGRKLRFDEFRAQNGFGGLAPAAEFDEKTALEAVTRQIAQARKQETGRWAFNQAVNDKDLQSRFVTTGVANCYVDRRGQTVHVDQFVKHVGGRCFYLDQGIWQESEEAGERKERVVELYSDEYFDLLKQNEDFRRAQKLGWAISINVGDERVVVEKDGKRSDLPEPPVVEQRVAPQPNAKDVPRFQQLQNAIPQNAVPQNFQQNDNRIQRQFERIQQAPNGGENR